MNDLCLFSVVFGTENFVFHYYKALACFLQGAESHEKKCKNAELKNMVKCNNIY